MRERPIVPFLVLVLTLLLGAWCAWWWLHGTPILIRVHLESVGSGVESGIARHREALRGLGVDVNPN